MASVPVVVVELLPAPPGILTHMPGHKFVAYCACNPLLHAYGKDETQAVDALRKQIVSSFSDNSVSRKLVSVSLDEITAEEVLGT